MTTSLLYDNWLSICFLYGLINSKKTNRFNLAPANQISIETHKGTVDVDVSKLEAWSKRMEEVAKKLEKAQQSGDQAAMDQAIKEMTLLQGEQPSAAGKP